MKFEITDDTLNQLFNSEPLSNEELNEKILEQYADDAIDGRRSLKERTESLLRLEHHTRKIKR
jgi:hypothetical protein